MRKFCNCEMPKIDMETTYCFAMCHKKLTQINEC